MGAPRLRSSAVGVPACAAQAAGFRPGYIMLMREGDGEGALEDTALDTREALMSHFCNCSKSSSCVGPPEIPSTSYDAILILCLISTHDATMIIIM